MRGEPESQMSAFSPIFGKSGKIHALFVGYRWYDEQKLSPEYPFGYGLSYTTFGYSGLRCSRLPGAGSP
jgi:beta-glucosidase